MNQSDNATGKENSEDGFSDKVTREKIDKHLRDINDKISEEDIRNVITNINSDDQIENDIEAANKKAAKDIIPPDEEAPQVPTTWNVID